ncbi:MAG: prepilin peptidase [Candidatus Thorarchaeota archaeon]
MSLEVTLAGLIAFSFTTLVLLLYSVLDIRTRRISNEIMALGITVALVIGVLTNHLLEMPFLHLGGFIVSVILGYSLFRLKSIGGADAKALILIAISSPGVEFTSFESIVFESILGSLFPVLIMLLFGYLAYRWKPADEHKKTPLMPFLLCGYLILQVLAFV